MQRPKPPLKEKFVELTEALFRGEEPYAGDADTFWDAYLIVPINASCLIQLIQLASEESLLQVKRNIGMLFAACLDRMSATPTNSSEQTRQTHAIQLLTVLIRQLFMKKRLSHFNLIQLLTGLDKADQVFGKFVQALQLHMLQPSSRSDALALAIIFSAGNDNVNQNNLNGYYMHIDLSPTFIKILLDEQTTAQQVQDTVMLWSMLANYNKHELRNPYAAKLSRCKDTRVLEQIVTLFTTVLPEMTLQYIQLGDDEETVSKSIVSYMTSWFSGPIQRATKSPDLDSSATENDLPPRETALFLILYDLINTNAHFVTVLLQAAQQSPDKSSVLTALLSYTSYHFQHNRTPRAFMYTRLILLILLCMSENHPILNYMARDDTLATVRMCRQRPPPLPRTKKPRSLFCSFLDVALLFLKHNLRKKLDLVAYKLVFTVMHRLLYYLKTRRVRLEYHWSELWPTLTAVLHFTVVHLDDFKEHEECESFISSMMNIFNICIGYGETFLSDAESYDSMFYEIIRASDDFAILAKHVTMTYAARRHGDQSPILSSGDFSNVQVICNHFKPLLDEWQEAHKAKFLTPNQVMDVIKENYDALKFKPMDKLDYFTPYTEIPAEMGFFRQVLRTSTADYITRIMAGL